MLSHPANFGSVEVRVSDYLINLPSPLPEDTIAPLAQSQNAPDDFPLARALVPSNLTLATDDIAWALNTLASKKFEHQLYHAYLRGEHRLTYATKDYREAFKLLLEGLRCNVCPAVVSALTDRLDIKDFTVNGTTDQASWDTWEQARMAAVANRTHKEAIACGDAFINVWPDVKGIAQPYVHSVLEVCHRVDPERRNIITLAAKLWRDGKRYRLTLYYPDRLERYVTKSDIQSGTTLMPSSFTFYTGDTSGYEVENTYNRVPMFHFAFDSDTYGRGNAELRDVIPVQDALNKALADQVVAEEFAAFPQRYMMGVELDDDAQVLAGIQRILSVAAPDAKAGSFPATDLKQYQTVIEGYYQALCVMKGIPPHYFHMGGDFPSGEALRTAEARLVKRVIDTQLDFGDVWAQVVAFMQQVNTGRLVDNVVTTWMSAQSRAETEEITNIATKVKDLGVTVEQGQRELGYTDMQIAAMAAERRGEVVAV
jgi:hypothetical protein